MRLSTPYAHELLMFVTGCITVRLFGFSCSNFNAGKVFLTYLQVPAENNNNNKLLYFHAVTNPYSRRFCTRCKVHHKFSH